MNNPQIAPLLPPELINAIISEVDSKQVLLNLRLTSKTFSEIATPHAFRTFDVPMKSNAKRLAMEFWEALDLVRHVQEVRLNAPDGTEGFWDVVKDDEGNDVLQLPLTSEWEWTYRIEDIKFIFSNLVKFPRLHTLRLYCIEKYRPQPRWEDPDYEPTPSYMLELEICRAIASSKLVEMVQTFEIQHLLPYRLVLHHFNSPSSRLTSLTITDCLRNPCISLWFWRVITFPRLQHLHLEKVGIKIRQEPFVPPHTDLETFLLRHGSIKTLKLHKCLIAGRELDDPNELDFPRTWAPVWESVAEILPHLIRFDFEPAPRRHADENSTFVDYIKLVYGLYYSSLGYHSMPSYDWEANADDLPSERDEAVAWEELQLTLEKRR
ncbi:unnamed protein product [Cyclocybe aegerita]|uniref:F-box domain-containing protein n=1 Tax=Cyclocybe aegerita TaxID=1973307 RepID=A0A8S0WI45_CYCAE|nr:unnamed protein product [Cyclocybe aegerita]